MAEMGSFAEAQSKLGKTFSISIVDITIGIITFNFGILTIALQENNHNYPFSGGIGLIAGAVVCVTGIFGIVTVKKARAASTVDKIKLFVTIFRILVIAGIIVSLVHLAFGIWTLLICYGPDLRCGGPYHAAIFLTSGISLCFGFTCVIITVVTLIVSWKPLCALTSSVTDVPESNNGVKLTSKT